MGHAQSNLVAKTTRQEKSNKSFRMMAIAPCYHYRFWMLMFAVLEFREPVRVLNLRSSASIASLSPSHRCGVSELAPKHSLYCAVEPSYSCRACLNAHPESTRMISNNAACFMEAPARYLQGTLQCNAAEAVAQIWR